MCAVSRTAEVWLHTETCRSDLLGFLDTSMDLDVMLGHRPRVQTAASLSPHKRQGRRRLDTRSILTVVGRETKKTSLVFL